ncbi:hypothetical protein [Alcaligenes faecalis]|uniref:hypothetical protein n=1 Tax=Alcaligenes faecalis TaxID=511 RepID=UPI0024BC01AE|nr:hypothetical protein [Alcaligenes faecalis]WHQ45900.1 hypothetical protein E8D21_19815 [Alcaligenes faecalis]
MRRSRLLQTALANFLFSLIGIFIFGWIALIAAKSVLGYSVLDLWGLVTAGNWPILLGTGLIIGFVAFVAPMIFRQILATRILVLISVITLAVVDPWLAIAAVIAVLLSLGLVRAAHGGIGASIMNIFDFSDINLQWKVLFTFGGALIVLGITTMSRISSGIEAFLPWPVFSIYGLVTVAFFCFSMGFFIGNFYFPKIISSIWAMLAFVCVMLAINPAVGAIATVYGFLLMFVEGRQADKLYYVDDRAEEIAPYYSFIKNNEAAKMIEHSLTPATTEAEARGIYRHES